MTPEQINDLAQSIVNHQGSFSEMVEYTENKIRRAIAAAVAAERECTKEECAKVANGWDAPSDPRNESEQTAHNIYVAICALK